jgi:hypothetical protein
MPLVRRNLGMIAGEIIRESSRLSIMIAQD